MMALLDKYRWLIILFIFCLVVFTVITIAVIEFEKRGEITDYISSETAFEILGDVRAKSRVIKEGRLGDFYNCLIDSKLKTKDLSGEDNMAKLWLSADMYIHLSLRGKDVYKYVLVRRKNGDKLQSLTRNKYVFCNLSLLDFRQ